MSDHLAIVLLATALVIVVAILVSIAAGYLARSDGATNAAAITRAAAVFAATVTLAAALTSTLSPLIH